jgi:predicted RNA binding protein YcfA (HicA-like mRNA interferase family)
MSKLPRVGSRECVRALQNASFVIISKESSHIKMRRKKPYAQVIVPETRELAKGTLRAIIRQAGLTVDEFIALLD